jgi:hypothetical protein
MPEDSFGFTTRSAYRYFLDQRSAFALGHGVLSRLILADRNLVYTLGQRPRDDRVPASWYALPLR